MRGKDNVILIIRDSIGITPAYAGKSNEIDAVAKSI